VSNWLPSREQAIELLQKNNCPPKVINHCQAVAGLAIEIACQLQNKGQKVDLRLVEAGALLHDIGRSKSHGVEHGIVGASIAESAAVSEAVVNVIRRHVGGGITSEEAKLFGWPEGVYSPITLEEKIVSYADKRIDKLKVVPVDVEINKLKANGLFEAAERVRKLDEEIKMLLSD
jgi:uncharacterized protein